MTHVIVNEGKLEYNVLRTRFFQYSTSSWKEATDDVSVKDHLKRPLLFYGALDPLTSVCKALFEQQTLQLCATLN